jgi:hypothetical protein
MSDGVRRRVTRRRPPDADDRAEFPELAERPHDTLDLGPPVSRKPRLRNFPAEHGLDADSRAGRTKKARGIAFSALRRTGTWRRQCDGELL